MGKLLAVVLVIIAIASAYPIVTHMFPLPQDISTHGHAIDEQLNDTMWEAGISFVAAQLVLAFFVWSFTGRKPGSPLKNFPGGARVMVIGAFLLVGTEILALGVLGQKAWADGVFCAVQAGRHANPGAGGTIRLLLPLSRGQTENSAASIPTRSTKATRTISGWIRRTTWTRGTISCPANWSCR